MAHLRNTLLLGATCVSLALSSAAFAEPTGSAGGDVAIEKEGATKDAGAKKAEHKKEHKAHKAGKVHKAK